MVQEKKFIKSNPNSRGATYEREWFGFHASFEERPEFTEYVTGIAKAIQYSNMLNWNSQKPFTRLASMLFDSVKRLLPNDKKDDLHLYVSIGSPIDFWYGVDAFFELHGSIVTLDVTTKKKQKHKAQLLIVEEILNQEWDMWCVFIATKLLKREIELYNVDQ